MLFAVKEFGLSVVEQDVVARVNQKERHARFVDLLLVVFVEEVELGYDELMEANMLSVLSRRENVAVSGYDERKLVAFSFSSPEP